MGDHVTGWLRQPFLSQVENLTTNLFYDLIEKWEAMYEVTDEFKEKKQKKFISILEEVYDEISKTEEEKRLDMIREMDLKIKEYSTLKRELQLSDQEIPWTREREPYKLFLKEINDSMKQFEEMREKRLEKLHSLKDLENELSDLLEIPPLPEFPNPIPTDHQLDEIESHIFHLREEKINRIEYFHEAKQRIIELLRVMERDVEGEFELHIISSHEDNFIPSTSKINKLKEVKNSLEGEFKEMCSYRTSLIDRLVKLWDRINVTQDDRDAFLLKWPNVSKSHIKAVNAEIERCEEIKLANIKPIVEHIREQIVVLWDILCYSEQQRQGFEAFHTNHFSEDVLDLHEIELEKLDSFHKKYEHIYELADKREKLWKRMLHLDEIAMDKSRLFNNRGGQLLKEEKERKSLEINVPKVDKQLKQSLMEFSNEEGRPFLWFGVDLLAKVTKEWTERTEAKENKKLARIVEKIREFQVECNLGSRKYLFSTPCKKVEYQKQVEVEAKLGSQLTAQKRKMGTPTPTQVTGAKTRRCDLGQTMTLRDGGVRTPGRLPNIRTPLNVSTASIASYSNFQSLDDELAYNADPALSEDDEPHFSGESASEWP